MARLEYKPEDFAGFAKMSTNRHTFPSPQKWAFFLVHLCFGSVLYNLVLPQVVLLGVG
jgi:hypothetical protein